MSSLVKVFSIIGGLGCSVCGVVASGVTFIGSKVEREKELTLPKKKIMNSSGVSENEWLSDEEQAIENKNAKKELCARWREDSEWTNEGKKFIDQQCSGKALK